MFSCCCARSLAPSKQAVEYNTLDTLDSDIPGDPSPDSMGGEETRKLEEMLMVKNKQLESKLAEAKRAADAAQEQVLVLKQQLDDVERKSLEQGALVAKLEEQVYQSNAGSKNTRGFSAVHLSALLENEDEEQGGSHAHGDSPLSPSRRSAPQQEASNSMVAAVAEQRDRSVLNQHHDTCVVSVTGNT